MSKPDVLVIGEALIDIVETARGVTEHVGGSPPNVALGLGRRGRRVALLTRLGEDRRSADIVRHVRDSAVDVLAASFTDAATSTARATLAADGGASYRFDIDWDLPAAVPRHPSDARAHRVVGGVPQSRSGRPRPCPRRPRHALDLGRPQHPAGALT